MKVIDTRGSQEWDEYACTKKGASFYHNYAWRDFYVDFMKKDTHYLAAYDQSDRICGILPLVRNKSFLFGDYFVSLPFFNYGGIVADTANVAAALARAASKLCAEKGSSFIEYRHSRKAPGMPGREDKVSMRLRLPKTSDRLFNDFPTKLRSQIKRPTRAQPTLAIGKIELLPDFYRVFSINMRDLGTPVYSRRMFGEILDRFPDSTEIAVLYVNGQPGSAAFLVHDRQMTEIPWASTLQKFNRISLNMMLYWEVLQRAIEMRSQVFDFGRSSIGSGTYRFKKQWGAEPTQLYWDYWLREGESLPHLNPDNPKYAAAIWAWKRLPVGLSRILGPRIVSNLP